MIALDGLLARLAANAEAIAALARAVPADQARWAPSAEEWSILDVIGHLEDEEREDFRTRVRLTLADPEADWPPVDPARWVTARGSQPRELASALDAFLRERHTSLAWLASLRNPDWGLAHRHPRIGPMTAGEVLIAWVAHDHLHLRQLNELHWQWLSRSATPRSLDYAGGW